MRFLSLFSGIEAASSAAPPGWECVGFSEVNPFCCALLSERYPHVPNLGDITKITKSQIEQLGPIDLTIFGFPCTDLSIAGQRKGLHHEGQRTRSGLFFDAMRVVCWTRCRWVVIENVPGLFSSNAGQDFAAVVGEILGTEFDTPGRKGKKWQNSGVAVSQRGCCEWATLDAQWFGVPQRRRRVFFVVDFGDWAGRPPILLESESLSGDHPPRRETRQSAAAVSSPGAFDGGEQPAVTGAGDEVITFVPCCSFTMKDYGADMSEISPTLRAGGHSGSHANGGVMPAVCFGLDEEQNATLEGMGCLKARQEGGGFEAAVLTPNAVVRRITPREAERLQGFQDDHTLVTYREKDAFDGPRYKAVGNSFAVPVVRWIFSKIQTAQATQQLEKFPDLSDTTEEPF